MLAEKQEGEFVVYLNANFYCAGVCEIKKQTAL